MPAETSIPPADGPQRASGTETFLATHAALVERLMAEPEAARWGLTRARLARALERSVEHRFRDARPASAEVESYLRSLHLRDLALSCACSDANEQAWEYFLQHYREDLYAAARAICGGASEQRARDLADSLYAELYGLETRAEAGPDGATPARRPLFDYFHGRSKLSTWLRAVLAQRHIDSVRASRRTESLEEKETDGAGALRDGRTFVSADPQRARYLAMLQAAMLEAIAALPARDRLRLAYYYVHQKTLAEIGGILGEHEATSSRHLERARRELRRHVERILRVEKQLDEAQVLLCLEFAREEWPFDLTGALGAAEAPPAAKKPRVQEMKRDPF